MKNALVQLPQADLTPTSWAPAKDLSSDEWLQHGRTITRLQEASQWWLGDWWRYGEHRYGERVKAADDPSLPAFQTCADAGYVAGAFETSRRREVLSQSHHREVAALEQADQDDWLDKAEQHNWSRNELRRQLRDSRQKQLTAPAGTFNLIYADPPWDYSGEQHTRVESSGGARTHYPTLSLEQICDYQFADKSLIDVLADDAALFIWATSPLLPEALTVITAWDFTYKASFVWDKIQHNVGHYNSVRHELLLVATRGTCLPEVSTLIDSVQTIDRSDHSAKPERFYEIIETLYPSSSKLELFARQARYGWTSTGLELAS